MGIKFSEDIRSVTDLKRNTRSLLDQIHKTGRPVVPTVNGRADAVLMSATRVAEGDLKEIWDYIGEDGPREAEKFVARIEGQITTLEQYPERCLSVPGN